MSANIIISDLKALDLRFPTSQQLDGSDAMHPDPDYSCAYVILETNIGVNGFGLTFTLGKGTEVVIAAINALKNIVLKRSTKEIFTNFGQFWREITSDSQLRWIGPEKGVIHLATAAVINALWDLWARLEQKPVWKLLTDMTPAELISVVDFRYINDVLTPAEALAILEKGKPNRQQLHDQIVKAGYPAYTTQVGWLGYSDEKVKHLCKEYLEAGFTAFKIKVGQDLEQDKHRCALVRQEIGPNNYLMIDANQVWDVPQAIDWVKQLSASNPLFIEEPTSPDDIIGHAAIAKGLEQHNIGVATGEMCSNRVMFKQFFQANAMQFCQLDSCRLGGVNEILSVYLMAKKFNVKVCPHAGGVGLCEMVQHLQAWDYVCCSQTKEGRWIEWVDQQHENFVDPARVTMGHYQVPLVPGYSTEIKPSTIETYGYPNGSYWRTQQNKTKNPIQT